MVLEGLKASLARCKMDVQSATSASQCGFARCGVHPDGCPHRKTNRASRHSARVHPRDGEIRSSLKHSSVYHLLFIVSKRTSSRLTPASRSPFLERPANETSANPYELTMQETNRPQYPAPSQFPTALRVTPLNRIPQPPYIARSYASPRVTQKSSANRPKEPSPPRHCSISAPCRINEPAPWVSWASSSAHPLASGSS
jgi:hypothetical protein